MEITRLGHASFKIRGKRVTLVTDPFDPDFVGFKFPKIEAEIVTISHNHSDHNYKQAFSNHPFFVEGPGEYEIADVFIKGISTNHDDKEGKERGKNNIYRIEIDHLHLAHLGDLGHKLNSDQTNFLGDIDILFIPVGGVYTINAKTAAEVVAQIEPTMVIPMHYYEERLNQNSFGSLAKVEEFFAEMGKQIKSIPKLVVTKEKLPSELEVIALA